MSTSTVPPPVEPVPKKKEKVIVAFCPDCKKQFQKTRALRYFGKCSQMKDFVRRYESLQLLAGQLLLKKQGSDFSAQDAEELEKVNKLLNNPDAIKRYAQVIERRNRLAAKKKTSPSTTNEGEVDGVTKTKKKKTIRERANLDEELVVPPPSKDFDEEEMEVDGCTDSCEDKSLLEL